MINKKQMFLNRGTLILGIHFGLDNIIKSIVKISQFIDIELRFIKKSSWEDLITATLLFLCFPVIFEIHP